RMCAMKYPQHPARLEPLTRIASFDAIRPLPSGEVNSTAGSFSIRIHPVLGSACAGQPAAPTHADDDGEHQEQNRDGGEADNLSRLLMAKRASALAKLKL